MSNPDHNFDVLVIGAGIAGLISACQLGQAGKKVLLVEKLSFLGGRFSAFPFDGAEISSGAFHTFPHGAGGPMALALKRLGIQMEITKPSVLASFYLNHQHIVSQTAFDLSKVLPNRHEKAFLWRLLFQMIVQKKYAGSYGAWMKGIGASDLFITIFDRFCQFALSTSVFSVPYAEGRQIGWHIFKYGLPGVPAGGARGVVQQLSKTAVAAGVKIFKTSQVETFNWDPETGKITGAAVYNRRTGERIHIRAAEVISTIGPQPTYGLLKRSGLDLPVNLFEQPMPPAIGLKLHVISTRSLIDHDSIMFCLDTQRVAGILQATNADPSLAPPGKHLLISHQMIRPGADWQAEKACAIADWQYIFGKDFEACEVIGASQFPERFPVNWAEQGADLRQQPLAAHGLWLAGDAVKPAGMMMVEGVAASALQVTSQILERKAPPF